VKTLPLTEARKGLPRIVDEVSSSHEHVVITKQGRPKAVVMSTDEFDGWLETIEILSDPKAMRAIREGLADIKAGRVHRWEDVKAQLRI
jgi:prevent-host-death family protein